MSAEQLSYDITFDGLFITSSHITFMSDPIAELLHMTFMSYLMCLQQHITLILLLMVKLLQINGQHSCQI
jgi:hypothetical protein